MQTKGKSRLRVSVDKIVEEVILRELQSHDDIARLVWWAGSLSRAELVSSSSGALRTCLGDKSIVAQVVAVDLGAASAVIDRGALSLHQKVVITKGVTFLLYAQCMLLLKDLRTAVKKSVVAEYTSASRPALPRSKSRSKQQALATTDDFRGELWNNSDKKWVRDRKIRLECLDTRMKTPNANDGFAYNKIIMGVGIYSQYEFDENNNFRKQLTHIVKWNNPSESSVRFEDVTDAMKFSSRVCDAIHPDSLSGYLSDLRDKVADPRDGVKLRKVKYTL
ncbi:hypothetical protein X943_003780 [Babesia divergens]|uniref:Uncharacterized protein n=1 Tax=Babesia divergens TaxID=32595 RepID=A0AAD9LFX1_BABDI|nr:hypothetical protein X943_003780 [Babesia divergens]